MGRTGHTPSSSDPLTPIDLGYDRSRQAGCGGHFSSGDFHTMNAQRFFPLVLASLCSLGATATSQAAQVYAGAGLSGIHAGYGYKLSNHLSVRGELAGGLKIKRDGRREGLDYSGEFSTTRGAALIDFYPMAGGLRLTAGLTANRTRVTLNGRGTNGTVNGKPVDLTGETFQVRLNYPSTTPYIGIGWAHQPDATGLGFFADVGVQIGRFKTEVSTSLVGKYGITQADVDAEAKKVRDSVNKLSVLPSVSMGLTYGF